VAQQPQLLGSSVGATSRAEALTPRQERALVVAAGGGDADARCKLVDVFMPAIAGLALGFPAGAAVERQELHQQGVVGLLFAARRYDPERNTPFWSYASFWVRKAMQELVAELARPVSLSDRAVRSLARIRTARSEHLQAHGSEPTNEQLSDATGFTPEQLESLQATERMPRAFEELLRVETETSGTVGDSIVDPLAEQAYERVLDTMELRDVRAVADQLDELERAVIRAHYGLGQPAQTLDQIGRGLGLTAERARQIEAGALAKMREALAPPPRRSNGRIRRKIELIPASREAAGEAASTAMLVPHSRV
jgi:RNA polymerase sigma factor (sigma-70 family)